MQRNVTDKDISRKILFCIIEFHQRTRDNFYAPYHFLNLIADHPNCKEFHTIQTKKKRKYVRKNFLINNSNRITNKFNLNKKKKGRIKWVNNEISIKYCTVHK